LPGALYEGALIQNAFVQVCLSANARHVLPPRFALLLALELTEHRYKGNEIVYHAHDHAFNLFLVTQGTFAHVARPTPAGGEAEILKPPTTVRATDLPRPCLQSGKTTTSLLRLAMGSAPVAPSTGRTCCLISTTRLHPFQLFSSHAYCGDVELFSGKTRHSSLRNETVDQENRPSDGTMLVMSKSELNHICEEFPQYKEIWEAEAERRRRDCERLLKKLTQPRSYKDLAATTIQRFVRQFFRQKRLRQLDAECSLQKRPQKGRSMFSHLNQLRAANADVPVGASRPGSGKDEIGALRKEIQAHGRQLEQALEGISLLLGHGKHSRRLAASSAS